MKKSLLVAFLIPFIVSAQSTVDRVTNTLDSLSSVIFDGWKMSPDLKSARAVVGDPTGPAYDDSKWEVLNIDRSVYLDSCWLRREIVLPERILGQPVAGRVHFLTTVDDYGYLWVNGESKGRFLWDGDFVLTENGKPGDRFVLAIRAINTGGPLRILRAELDLEKARNVRQSIKDLVLSLRVGQKLLSFDTYQENAYSGQKEDPGIDKSSIQRDERTRLQTLLQEATKQINLDAIKQGRIADYQASVDNIRPSLKQIDQFVKQFSLIFTSNAHIDAAWLWREKETMIVAKNTFSSVLRMMDSRPDFTYTQSAAQYYEWMEQLYPDIYAKIQQRLTEGRWEAIGGMWIEPDCNMPDGVSWFRHMLFAQKYFKAKFGKQVTIGWNPDSFGYTWNMPQFFQLSGIDAFITQKISWNDTNVFPYRVFWWQSPDGSRVLVYFPFSYVNNVAEPFGLVDWLRQFEANTGFRSMMVLFGVGDHGGGPTDDMLDRIERMKKLDIYPTVKYATALEYIQWLKQQNTKSIPVWNDELYLEYHQGTGTTQAKTKESNRRTEVLLTQAETFSTLATLTGKKYPSFAAAWKNVLFNQFHDILPGSSIREVYIDAAERYRESNLVGKNELEGSLQAIAKSINTSSIKKGTPLIVFNSLGWERTDVARYQLPERDNNDYAIFDQSGKEVVAQTIQVNQYQRELIFVAERIPAIGYKTFELRKQKPSSFRSPIDVSEEKLENEEFKIVLDSDSGWIESIIDKRTGTQLLDGYGNRLQALEDKPAQWDAWNIGWTGREYPTIKRKIEILHNGPVLATLRIHRDMLGPAFKRDYPAEGFPSSFFMQDITLYRGIDRIDFDTHVDWWEERTMLKVAFQLAITDTVATYEVPYGTIQRSTQLRNSWERAKVEVPALRWADVSADGYGVSLINNAKYAYDIKGSSMRLSLLRSPKWPDPTADRGKHSISYSLYPHTGSWKEANTVQRGYEFNTLLNVITADKHSGEFPPSNSLISIAPGNVMLTVVKIAEDGTGWIVQWYESAGIDTEVKLILPKTPKKAMMSDFLENEGESLPVAKNIVTVTTPARSIRTLKVIF